MPHEKAATRLSLILLACFILLFLNMFRMQILKGDYYRSLSERNRLRVICLESPRGKILDRAGRALADSRLSFNCTAVAREARTRIAQSCRLVGEILGVTPAELEKRYSKKKAGAFNTLILAENITPQQAMAIEERLDLLPGFLIETRPQREYPLGEAAAHLVGFLGPMNEEEVAQFDDLGYRADEWIGRDGLEKQAETYLRGRSGGIQMEVDSRGKMLRALGVKEPQEGKDIQLTVDSRLQSVIHDLLGGRKGAVIVMELNEGGLLALNSSPSFDPNLFASTAGRKKVGHYLVDSAAPMIDRGIRGRYPPGSIFKIVTALAALEKKKITPFTLINCAGSVVIGGNEFHCWSDEGHGPQDLTLALTHSCNAFFYTVGVRAGVEAIVEKALAFGFSKISGVDLPDEKPGFVPSREWKRAVLHQGWFEGDTANLAIGQGMLQVTPMQALVMIAAVASNGQVFTPHVIDKINGVKIGERQAHTLGAELSHLKAVKAGLEQVVNSDSGTGRLARVPGLHVAAKTGTAQSGQNKTHAWFVGYAPVEDPKVALVVFLENGGRGGVVAAKLAAQVLSKLKEMGYV